MAQRTQYDIIVIGGGHAGAEAAWGAANLLRPDGNCGGDEPGRVALITLDPDKIGAMSCNPAIGGLAKGQIVREIDALGGLMGLAIDATGLQFRILNATKGPAVRGPRAQADKYLYAKKVQALLRTRNNLDIITATVDDILIEDGRCIGVTCSNHKSEIRNQKLSAAAVVLTTGTFMRGLMHTGTNQTHGGRVGEAAVSSLSDALVRHGFELGRLKTGTPPRLDAQTIDFASLEIQRGDEQPAPFSDLTNPHSTDFPAIEQRPCHITQTNQAAHDAIAANLHRAPMYNGQIHQSAGPRYCPSIEDKVVRFENRKSHHVFLEPESLATNEVYANGISTSLPKDVQEIVVRHMPGCEKAHILRYGYAVEYDMVWPHQIDATTMAKKVAGLFLAGQINGTSGYEEAAGQGLLAGVNAVRYARKQDMLRLRRDQAYIGVLMDDLVTKMPREPYRMFTSRAEYRLLLRADNADTRLTALGWELGLVDEQRWSIFTKRQEARQALEDYIDTQNIGGQPMRRWLRRPDVDPAMLLGKINGDPLPAQARSKSIAAQLLADVQYEGYIQRHQEQIERLTACEHMPLPNNHDYRQVTGLRNEAALVLNKFQPTTLGQAGRLAGVNPADLMLINIALARLN